MFPSIKLFILLLKLVVTKYKPTWGPNLTTFSQINWQVYNMEKTSTTNERSTYYSDLHNHRMPSET